MKMVKLKKIILFYRLFKIKNSDKKNGNQMLRKKMEGIGLKF
jgi:cytochrome c oxidase assembly protein Cox11